MLPLLAGTRRFEPDPLFLLFLSGSYFSSFRVSYDYAAFSYERSTESFCYSIFMCDGILLMLPSLDIDYILELASAEGLVPDSYGSSRTVGL